MTAPDIKTASAHEIWKSIDGANIPSLRLMRLLDELVAERDRLRSLLDASRVMPDPEDVENTIHRINTVTGSAWAEVAWDEDAGTPELLAIRPYTGWVSADDLDPAQVEEWERIIAAEEAAAAVDARVSWKG